MADTEMKDATQEEKKEVVPAKPEKKEPSD